MHYISVEHYVDSRHVSSLSSSVTMILTGSPVAIGKAIFSVCQQRVELDRNCTPVIVWLSEYGEIAQTPSCSENVMKNILGNKNEEKTFAKSWVMWEMIINEVINFTVHTLLKNKFFLFHKFYYWKTKSNKKNTSVNSAFGGTGQGILSYRLTWSTTWILGLSGLHWETPPKQPSRQKIKKKR